MDDKKLSEQLFVSEDIEHHVYHGSEGIDGEKLVQLIQELEEQVDYWKNQANQAAVQRNEYVNMFAAGVTRLADEIKQLRAELKKDKV